MARQRQRESWNTRIGVILAVAGSAVGLGNFIRFPSLVAEFGGGAFMIAYVISFILIGLPICWAEWAMGRSGGVLGYNSAPGIFAAVSGSRAAKWFGVIGVIIPVVIYMYYVYVEAWCLGYAVNFLLGNLDFQEPDAASAFWSRFIGMDAHGSAVGFGIRQVGVFLIIVFIFNFFLIYRGVARGIEWFCKYALPTLVILALIILVRVFTLGTPDTTFPERNVLNGLGFMWNPTKTFVDLSYPGPGGAQKTEAFELVSPQAREEPRQFLVSILERELRTTRENLASLPADTPETRRTALAATAATLERQLTAARGFDGNLDVRRLGILEQLGNPSLWLAAASQIFFSLSIGFGVIITYSSYMKRDDDVVLSGLAASSANEFAEVGIGGLMTIPAAVAFLGTAGLAGMGTFGLGFNVLPLVFAKMPGAYGPEFFGFLFFFLLFLAAVTSSLSMLQPGIAFLEESMNIDRRQSVALLGAITAAGCGFIVYFSEGLTAMDTIDFWVVNLLMVSLALFQVLLFGWVIGVERGFSIAHAGAAIRIPRLFAFIIKFITPLALAAILLSWLLLDALNLGGDGYDPRVEAIFIEHQLVPILSVGVIILVGALVAVLIAASPRLSAAASAARKGGNTQ